MLALFLGAASVSAFGGMMDQFEYNNAVGTAKCPFPSEAMYSDFSYSKTCDDTTESEIYTLVVSKPTEYVEIAALLVINGMYIGTTFTYSDVSTMNIELLETATPVTKDKNGLDGKNARMGRVGA